MNTPEENQMSICLLQTNLQEIESDYAGQCSAWPDLDAENEQKYRKTLNTLREVRSLSAASELLNQENVRLCAKRMQLKRQSETIWKALENERLKRTNMENALKQEEKEAELQIRRYEDSLREKSDRFRKTLCLYNEENMLGEIAKVNDEIVELEAHKTAQQAVVDDLRRQLDGMQREVPEDLLASVGKRELEEKLKSLTKKLEELQRERDDLLKGSANK